MAKYDIAKEATEDLYRIWEYTVDAWSEEQADIYYGILETAMDAVGSAPAPPPRLSPPGRLPGYPHEKRNRVPR